MMNELLSSLPVWRILLVADTSVRRFYERFGFSPFENVLARFDRRKLYDPK